MEDLARLYLAEADGDAERALRLALADALVTVERVQSQVSRGYVRGRLAAPEWMRPLALAGMTAPEPDRTAQGRQG